MNHDNVTEQIHTLAEDIQLTKDTLLGKLEVTINDNDNTNCNHS